MRQLALDIAAAPNPTLDNFEPSGNEPALAHLRLWLGSAVRAPVPTLLWGEAGSGKSHLLRAVAAGLTARAEAWGWLDADAPPPRSFDPAWQVLLLDDCQRFDEARQALAFQWFVQARTPSDGRARWVLASADRPPADLRHLRDDLRSRLGWGDVFQLHALDEPARLRVVQRAASERGLNLGDEVLGFMTRRFARDLGTLMGLLDRLDAFALQQQRAITVPLIKAMLAEE